MNGRKKPAVWVDGVVFENRGQIGIWRVFYEVMRRLAGRVDYTLWLRAPAVQPLPQGVRVVSDRARWYGPWRHPISRLQAEWSRRIGGRTSVSADVFHSTYFTARPHRGPAVVTTVHDMIAEIAYPYSGGAAWVDTIRAKRAEIESADLCVAVSASTAADLGRIVPGIGDRVRVIHHGHEHLARAVANRQPQPECALFVGHRDGYKNFATVLEAMTHPTWPRELSLRVVGASLAEHELDLIRYYGLDSRVVEVGRVTDAQLSAEYAAAACFVFPSRLEGFGLPVVEAQLNGCPVVCSDIPVFREVAGVAAVFFDPRLGERLAEAVAEATEPQTQRRVVEAGYNNVKRFSWDRAAEHTLAVYEEAAAMPRV